MDLDTKDAFMASALFQVLVSVLVVCKKGSKLWIWEVDMNENVHKIRILFLLCPLFAGIGYIFDIIAVSYMPIGDAMAIIFSGALPTVLLARLFLREKLRLCRIICSALLVSGIILVVRPPFVFGDDVGTILYNGSIETTELDYKNEEKATQKHYYIGVLAAFICMFSYAIFGINVRYLQHNIDYASPEVFLLYHGFYCTVLSVIMYIFENNDLILFRITIIMN